uniref:SWI/SNF related BAF chromatin remodeling complex subunit D2 n=1 Tax=Gadus morhua TaxID=8049 RepID=A0A8C5AZ18_GADMO
MSSRGGFSSPPLNAGMNPMIAGHTPGMRMAGMPHNLSGYHRSMVGVPQYHQRPGMQPHRGGAPLGSMGSMGGQMPGPSYGGGNMAMRPSMGPATMDPSRKRFLHQQQQQQQPQGAMVGALRRGAKRRKMADKVLPQRIRDLVPESQAYMDLLAFERKLDQTIARKRMEIQEAIKKPITWHRMAATQETDGFQVKRPGEINVKCTLLLMLDHQPPQYKLDLRLARLLGVHTQTRASIMQALWLYIKTNKLQDCHEKEFINCNRYFRQIFSCARMKFSEIPMKLAGLLQHPDPIVINHLISVESLEQKKTACYDIDVEVDDPLKGQMNGFLSSTTNQQEIAVLEMKIHETIESINQLKTQRDFMLSFSNHPQDFIQDWLKSQSRDLKLMTDVAGNPEEERRAEFYQSPWLPEAVGRYVYSKVQQRRQELEQVLGIRLT